MLTLLEASRLILKAFRSKKQRKMRKATSAILKSAVLDFSEEIYSLAVYSYVLSKILSKPRFMGRLYYGKRKEIDAILSRLVSHAEKKRRPEFSASLRELEKAVRDVETQDARYIKNMVEKGKLKTAATLYAQGLSLSRAAQITGVEKQEIMDYAGKTMMFDRVEESGTLQKRLKKARRILMGDAQ
jgi:hypothetical protein